MNITDIYLIPIVIKFKAHFLNLSLKNTKIMIDFARMLSLLLIINLIQKNINLKLIELLNKETQNLI